jgi:DmX-like protein
MDNIKRMSSHPLMPLYLTGSQDGSVQMWEWGHQQAVCTPRPPGTFAKGIILTNSMKNFSLL